MENFRLLRLRLQYKYSLIQFWRIMFDFKNKFFLLFDSFPLSSFHPHINDPFCKSILEKTVFNPFHSVFQRSFTFFLVTFLRVMMNRWLETMVLKIEERTFFLFLSFSFVAPPKTRHWTLLVIFYFVVLFLCSVLTFKITFLKWEMYLNTTAIQLNFFLRFEILWVFNEPLIL